MEQQALQKNNRCHTNCKEIITAACDIEHLQGENDQLRNDMRRLFDKLDATTKWLILLFVGMGIETVAIFAMIVVTLYTKTGG